MAFIVRDRVQETSTTTGTGTLTLNGAVTGYQSFGSAIGEGNATYYAIVNSDNPAQWEVGSGVIFGSSPDPITMARVIVYSSSNANAKVNFSAGTKQVFCTYAASRAVIRNTSGRVGIGTDDPLGTLEVTGVEPSIMTRTFSSPPGVPQSAMQIGLGGTAVGAIGTGPSFLFFNNNSASTKTFLGRLTAIIEDPTAGSEKGGIALSVRQNGADSFANTEVVRITADSKVGVGTTIPSEKLDVVGNVKSNKIILNGSTSGSVTLDTPAVAGTATITLPTTASSSTTNTVTNKIAIVINGTTYYLLASTNGT